MNIPCKQNCWRLFTHAGDFSPWIIRQPRTWNHYQEKNSDPGVTAWENTERQINASLSLVVPTSEECEKRWRVLSEVKDGGGEVELTLLIGGWDGPDSSLLHCWFFLPSPEKMVVVALIFGCYSSLMSSTSNITPARSKMRHFRHFLFCFWHSSAP